VGDQGAGIGADDLKRLFQPFVQINAGQQQSGMGTGLGLAIARRLAQLHGGDITVESTEGQGSTFIFTFVADACPPLPPVQTAAAVGGGVGLAIDSAALLPSPPLPQQQFSVPAAAVSSGGADAVQQGVGRTAGTTPAVQLQLGGGVRAGDGMHPALQVARSSLLSGDRADGSPVPKGPAFEQDYVGVSAIAVAASSDTLRLGASSPLQPVSGRILAHRSLAGTALRSAGSSSRVRRHAGDPASDSTATDVYPGEPQPAQVVRVNTTLLSALDTAAAVGALPHSSPTSEHGGSGWDAGDTGAAAVVIAGAASLHPPPVLRVRSPSRLAGPAPLLPVLARVATSADGASGLGSFRFRGSLRLSPAATATSDAGGGLSSAVYATSPSSVAATGITTTAAVERVLLHVRAPAGSPLVTATPSDTPVSPLPAWASRRALVVDDSDMNRALLSRVLRSLGFTCEVAENGAVALSKVSASCRLDPGDDSPASRVPPFSLITLDRNMPGLGGEDTARALRAPPLSFSGLIVGITGDTDAVALQRFAAAGTDVVLVKPVSKAQLAAELSRRPPPY
jgi:CheY-like chemotaxis protein